MGIIIDEDATYSEEFDHKRRDFLKLFGAAAASSTMFASDLFGSSRRKKKILNLYSVHLNRSYKAEYFDGYRYNITGLFAIDKAMMDFRAWQIARIDLRLVELLHEINRFVGFDREIFILSGYRSPQTNRYLRLHSRGVAKNSYHVKAQAADIYIPHYKLYKLRDLARSIGVGGVGYYPRSNFVHIDVGPVRYWRRG